MDAVVLLVRVAVDAAACDLSSAASAYNNPMIQRLTFLLPFQPQHLRSQSRSYSLWSRIHSTNDGSTYQRHVWRMANACGFGASVVCETSFVVVG